MLYKPPGAVYIASYKELLDQSDRWKLFSSEIILIQDTNTYYMLASSCDIEINHSSFVTECLINLQRPIQVVCLNVD